MAASSADRLENYHGLSRRNHTSRVTNCFTYFGDRAFARASNCYIVSEKQGTPSFTSFASFPEPLSLRCACCLIRAVLRERPSPRGAIYVWEHSRNGRGWHRRCDPGYADYAAQH